MHGNFLSLLVPPTEEWQQDGLQAEDNQMLKGLIISLSVQETQPPH